MKRVLLIEKRRKAKLLRKKGWSILKIARHLGSHWDNVKKWLEMDERDVEADQRGRYKHRPVKYGAEVESRIIAIRKILDRQKESGCGSRFIKMEYRKRYGQDISEWFINKTLREHRKISGLELKNTDSRRQEGYPLRKLKKYGNVIMSLDFIEMKLKRRGGGEKNTTEPAPCFLCCKYLYPQKMGFFIQVNRPTGDEVVRILKHLWLSYVKPDLVKLTYHSAFGASLSMKRCIGRLPIFMLNLGITPLYASGGLSTSPIPGIHSGQIGSLFSDALSRRLNFGNNQPSNLIPESVYIEYRQCGDEDYTRLRLPERYIRSIFNGLNLENREVGRFMANRIFFLRRVDGEEGATIHGRQGILKVLCTDIEMDPQWIDALLICLLDLKKKLLIYSEGEDGGQQLVKKLEFWLANVKYS